MFLGRKALNVIRNANTKIPRLLSTPVEGERDHALIDTDATKSLADFSAVGNGGRNGAKSYGQDRASTGIGAEF